LHGFIRKRFVNAGFWQKRTPCGIRVIASDRRPETSGDAAFPPRIAGRR
jgi:hypothetical protein